MTSSEPSDIPVLILAAGAGKIMGMPKALVQIPNTDKSFLAAQVEKLSAFSCLSLNVVVGASGKQVISLVKNNRLPVHIVENLNWEDGQFSSLFVGLKQVFKNSEWVLVLPVDSLGVKHSTFEKLLFCKDKIFDALIPTFKGRRGHPVLLSNQFCKKCLLLNPKNSRLDAMLREALVLEVEVDDSGIRHNVNTKEDLSAIF